ncbi:hypothetical protein J7M23_01590 [Candidatus Sumerlaeota bacterium]|nr:hypothetical protein [Candidatus Sumerlaeota bacterium]
MLPEIKPALLELGKIKIGKKGSPQKTRTGKVVRMPQKMDHFVITRITRNSADDLETDQELMKKIAEATGQKTDRLTRIPVVLLFNDIEHNFYTFRALYTKSRLYCKSENGDRAIWFGEDGKEPKEIRCDPQKCKYALRGDCKVNGILSVIIPVAPRLGGVYKFRTTSKNTIKSILASLSFIKMMTLGQIAGVELELTLTPKTVTTPEGRLVTIFVVNVEYPGNFLELKKQVVEQLKEQRHLDTELQKLAELPPASFHEESPEEQREVQEEFYPEEEPKETEPPERGNDVIDAEYETVEGSEEVPEQIADEETESEREDIFPEAKQPGQTSRNPQSFDLF